MSIICQEWQIKATEDWELTKLLHQDNCTIYHEIINQSVIWSNNPDIYLDDRLIKWLDRLKNFRPLLEADIVISDNLSGVLAVRPDAILMGSFLWLDILKIHKKVPKVKEFIDFEKSLLKKKPPMLCVGTIAMPAVFEYTHAIPLPWFGLSPKSTPKIRREQKIIALVGGATPAADDILLSIANELLEKSNYTLTMSAKFFSRITSMDTTRLYPFGFQQKDYEACDLVICRPGIGTITECMVSNTPMLLIPEISNSEMVHNTNRLVELGMAYALPSYFSTNDLLKALEFIFKPDIFDSMAQIIEKQEVNGFEAAVKWIIQYRHLN